MKPWNGPPRARAPAAPAALCRNRRRLIDSHGLISSVGTPVGPSMLRRPSQASSLDRHTGAHRRRRGRHATGGSQPRDRSPGPLPACARPVRAVRPAGRDRAVGPDLRQLRHGPGPRPDPDPDLRPGGRPAGHFNAAFQIPELLFSVIVASGLAAPFIPIFTNLERDGGEAAAYRFGQTILTLALAAMLVVAVVLFVLAPVDGRGRGPGLRPEAQRPVRRAVPAVDASARSCSRARWPSARSSSCGAGSCSTALAPLLYNAGIVVGRRPAGGPHRHPGRGRRGASSARPCTSASGSSACSPGRPTGHACASSCGPRRSASSSG